MGFPRGAVLNFLQGLPLFFNGRLRDPFGGGMIQSKKQTAASQAADCACLHICLLCVVLSSISCKISEGPTHCLGAGVLRVDWSDAGEVFESMRHWSWAVGPSSGLTATWSDRVLKSWLGFLASSWARVVRLEGLQAPHHEYVPFEQRGGERGGG